MSSSEKDIELIDRFLKGSLSEVEFTAFESRVSNDAVFANQLKELKLLRQGARLSKMESLFETLKDTEAKSSEATIKPIQTNRRSWIKYAAAASVVFLIGLTYFLLNPTEPNSEKIFAEAFTPYPNNVIKRSGSDTNSDLKKSAYLAYDSKQFEKSIPLFQELLKTEGDSITLFYMANAYLANQQSDEALETFNTFLPNAGQMTNQTNWYLSLTYLQRGDFEKCREILEELSAGTSSYGARSVKLLEEME